MVFVLQKSFYGVFQNCQCRRHALPAPPLNPREKAVYSQFGHFAVYYCFNGSALALNAIYINLFVLTNFVQCKIHLDQF